MIRYQCKQCGKDKWLPAGADVHAVSWCGCCRLDHHHGASVLNARDCQVRHPGQPCWNPPKQPVKPPGCTVCRPVRKFAEAELFGIGVQ